MCFHYHHIYQKSSLFSDTTCSPSAFTCANQRCVPTGWRCDGHNDCFDNSDENNCPMQVPGTCPVNQFTCANHRCIPHIWLCDTDNDCGDGSDEVDCREYPYRGFPLKMNRICLGACFVDSEHKIDRHKSKKLPIF